MTPAPCDWGAHAPTRWALQLLRRLLVPVGAAWSILGLRRRSRLRIIFRRNLAARNDDKTGYFGSTMKSAGQDHHVLGAFSPQKFWIFLVWI